MKKKGTIGLPFFILVDKHYKAKGPDDYLFL